MQNSKRQQVGSLLVVRQPRSLPGPRFELGQGLSCTTCRLIHKLEGGGAYSKTLRRVYKEHYQMEIGDYLMDFFDVRMVKRNTRVGRYSIRTETARCETAKHPGNTFSSNAFFNAGLK